MKKRSRVDRNGREGKDCYVKEFGRAMPNYICFTLRSWIRIRTNTLPSLQDVTFRTPFRIGTSAGFTTRNAALGSSSILPVTTEGWQLRTLYWIRTRQASHLSCLRNHIGIQARYSVRRHEISAFVRLQVQVASRLLQVRAPTVEGLL